MVLKTNWNQGDKFANSDANAVAAQINANTAAAASAAAAAGSAATAAAAAQATADSKQPADSDLTAVANLAPADGDTLLRVAGAWANRTMAQLKTALGLGNADNTSDANKPVSTAQQAALDAKGDVLTPATAIVTASTAPTIGQITLYNAAGGNLTPSLPALSGIAVGRRLAVRRDPADTSANTVTFSLPGGDTFYASGATSFTLPLAGEQREFQVISVSGTKYWVPAGSLNPLAGLDTRYANVLTASSSTTVSQVNAWLATPIANGGVHRLQGTLTINAPIIIPSNRTFDLRGATINLTDGSDCNMLRNSAFIAQRSVTDAATTNGSTTVTSATANFTTADVGRSIVIAAAGGNGLGPLVGKILSRTSATAVVIDTAAQATVSAAAASIFNRDTNITVIGGTWNRGNNAGNAATSACHNLLFRHVDNLYLDIEKITCLDGKYMIAPGDVNHYTVILRDGNTTGPSSASMVQVNGPAYDGYMPYIAGATNDDLLALTASDYPDHADVAGDIIGLQIGTLVGNSATRILNLLAGAGLRVDGIKVYGSIRGTAGTQAIRIGDDVLYAANSGGTYGTIDLGTIDVITGTYDLFFAQTDADEITARIRHRAESTGVKSVGFGNNTNVARTIKRLVLENCVWQGNALTSAIDLSASFETVTELVLVRPRFASTGVLVAMGGSTVGRITARDGVFLPITTTGGLFSFVSGTVDTLTIDNCVGTFVTGNYLVLLNTHQVLTKLVVRGGKHTGGTAVLNNISCTLSGFVCVLDDCTLVSMSRIFTPTGDSTLILRNPLFDTIVAAAAFVTTGPLVIKGDYRSNGTFSLLQRAGSESVRVIGPTLPVDVAQLTPTAGDICNNILGASAAGGTGPVVYDSNTATWVTLSRPTVKPINTQTGTTYTPVLFDTGRVVTLNNASAITVTIPPNSSVAYPVSAFIDFVQLGAGQVTFAPGAGVTLQSTPGLKIAAQYGIVRAFKIGSNTWLLTGNLSA